MRWGRDKLSLRYEEQYLEDWSIWESMLQTELSIELTVGGNHMSEVKRSVHGHMGKHQFNIFIDTAVKGKRVTGGSQE